MTIPFERFKQFVGDDGRLTLEAATFLEDLAQPQEWIEITPQGTGGKTDFQNSWVNAGGTDQVTAFYKDQFDRVWVKGVISTGASGTTAFTLPSDYRPSERIFFALLVSGAISGTFLTVNTNGTIIVDRLTGTNAFINVSFRV